MTTYESGMCFHVVIQKYDDVESTMRTGYENGYQVITLNDCVAATSLEEHENAITYDFPMFSRPMSATEFMAELAR